MRLRSLQRQVLNRFVEAVEASNPKEQFTIVLVGSAARRSDKPHSDLDIVLVGDQGLSIPSFHPKPLHVQAIPKDEFLGRLASGDDFVAWSLRFGVPIRGGDYWKTIKDSGQARVWPEWRRKVPQAAHRLTIARSLLGTADLRSAAEEMLYSTGHVARALLLKDRVFPRSRPEMVEQLNEAGWPDLARLLHTFMRDGAEPRSLSRAQQYLKKLILLLDKPAYNEFVAVRKKTVEQKDVLRIDPLARPAVIGRVRLLLALRRLSEHVAETRGVAIQGLEVRPAWSHEDDDRSRVVLEIQVNAAPEQRFAYWEDLSDSVESYADSLSPRERRFVNSSLSILVNSSHGV